MNAILVTIRIVLIFEVLLGYGFVQWYFGPFKLVPTLTGGLAILTVLVSWRCRGRGYCQLATVACAAIALAGIVAEAVLRFGTWPSGDFVWTFRLPITLALLFLGSHAAYSLSHARKSQAFSYEVS